MSTPSRKPPSAAPTRLPIPPMIRRRSRPAPAGSRASASRRRAARSGANATTPASRPLIPNATAITRLARTPSSRAIEKSLAAARICSPSVVRWKKYAQRQEEDRRDADRDQVEVLDQQPADRELTGEERRAGRRVLVRDVADRADDEVLDQVAERERRHSSVIGSRSRTGRNAIRSISSATTTTTTAITRHRDPDRDAGEDDSA